MVCPVAANGAPDCKAASDKFCQTKGFKEGKSLHHRFGGDLLGESADPGPDPKAGRLPHRHLRHPRAMPVARILRTHARRMRDCLVGMMSGILRRERLRLAPHDNRRILPNVHACLVQGPPVAARDRCAAVHHFRARSRDRAVQGRRRRLVSGAERAADGAARRVAGPDQGRAGRATTRRIRSGRRRRSRSTRSCTIPTTGSSRTSRFARSTRCR